MRKMCTVSIRNEKKKRTVKKTFLSPATRTMKLSKPEITVLMKVICMKHAKKINETNSNTNVPLRYSGGEAMIIQNFELIETNLPDYLYNLYL